MISLSFILQDYTSSSTHVAEIGFALGARPESGTATKLQPFRLKARLCMCDPIDDDPDIAEIILDKIKPLSIQPQREMIVLVGHGSDCDEYRQRWQSGLMQLAQRIGRLGNFAEAGAATLLPDQTVHIKGK